MGQKKFLRHFVQRTASKTGGVRCLEKELGIFDGRGCLGKVLARLHPRLPHGLGWDWCLEKEPGGELGKSQKWVLSWGTLTKKSLGDAFSGQSNDITRG